MHWIVQDNLINPTTRDQLLALLAERRTAVTRVRLIPLFNLLDGPAPTVTGPVFAYGSTGMGVVAKAQGWKPGYYEENLDYELMLAQYGCLALNAGAVSETLGAMQKHHERFFVRPVLDHKSFVGSVMTWDEFVTFRAGVAAVADEQDVTLRLSDRISVAPLTDIDQEYRFFVIGRQVVTGSRYKDGDHVSVSPVVPAELTQFAQKCADLWSPNEAYALDVAVTPAGPKVIELNSANSAGLYACDFGAIVDAVNNRLG